MSEEEKKSLWQNVRETVYGMAAHDMSRAALRTRASMEHLFILITMGDLLGIPATLVVADGRPQVSPRLLRRL